jgi:hypothetical protein
MPTTAPSTRAMAVRTASECIIAFPSVADPSLASVCETRNVSFGSRSGWPGAEPHRAGDASRRLTGYREGQAMESCSAQAIVGRSRRRMPAALAQGQGASTPDGHTGLLMPASRCRSEGEHANRPFWCSIRARSDQWSRGTSCGYRHRVSTEEQGRSGLVLEAQRHAIATHAVSKGWEVIRLTDEGMSARSPARPALQEALARAMMRVSGGGLSARRPDGPTYQ